MENKIMNIYAYQKFGYEGQIVTVESDIRRGIPMVDILGLADLYVKESREKLRAAFANQLLEFPSERLLISLSPADLRKNGTSYDLPMALSIMDSLERKNNPEKPVNEDKVLAMGETTLAGTILPVKGAYAAALSARTNGITKIICDENNAKEISTISGLEVAVVKNLTDAKYALTHENAFIKNKDIDVSNNINITFNEDKEIIENASGGFQGLYPTAHAVEVAVAGKHNLILQGAPECGKTMAIYFLVPALTPELTDKELDSQKKIKSLGGLALINPNILNDKTAPFRVPHQTETIEGIFGGGTNCRPGEITLAHNGILFLDEAAEFRSSVLQLLRVPLETHQITLARAGRSTSYPAKFQLMMASNLCPCGNYGCNGKLCLDSKKSIEMYNKKFSSPLLDRIEIRHYVEKNENDKRIFNLEASKERISKAYKIQRERGVFNADLTPADISKYCELNDSCKKFFEKTVEENTLTKRETINMLKVSLTLANMEGREKIQLKDLKEAYKLALPVITPDFSLNIDKKQEKELSKKQEKELISEFGKEIFKTLETHKLEHNSNNICYAANLVLRSMDSSESKEIFSIMEKCGCKGKYGKEKTTDFLTEVVNAENNTASAVYDRKSLYEKINKSCESKSHIKQSQNLSDDYEIGI